MKTNLPGKYEVVASAQIDKSQADVWSVLEDFANVYTWAPSVAESYTIGNAERGNGAGRHCKVEGFGHIDEYVTEWEEGTGFIYEITPLGPLDKSWSSWKIQALGDTRSRIEVKFSYNLRFGAFGKIMHKLVMRKKLEQSLPQVLESSEKPRRKRCTDSPFKRKPCHRVGFSLSSDIAHANCRLFAGRQLACTVSIRE